MPADKNLGTISIGIGVNLADLRSGLSKAREEVKAFKDPTKTIHMDVTLKRGWEGRVENSYNTFLAGLQAKVQEKPITVNARFKPLNGRDLYRDAQRELDATFQRKGKEVYKIPPLKIRFVADLESAKNLHASIQNAINRAGPVRVEVEWYSKNPPNPGGGPTGGSPSSPTKPGGSPTGGAPAQRSRPSATPPPPPVPSPPPAAGPKAKAAPGAKTPPPPSQPSPKPSSRRSGSKSATPPPVTTTPTTSMQDELTRTPCFNCNSTSTKRQYKNGQGDVECVDGAGCIKRMSRNLDNEALGRPAAPQSGGLTGSVTKPRVPSKPLKSKAGVAVGVPTDVRTPDARLRTAMRRRGGAPGYVPVPKDETITDTRTSGSDDRTHVQKPSKFKPFRDSSAPRTSMDPGFDPAGKGARNESELAARRQAAMDKRGLELHRSDLEELAFIESVLSDAQSLGFDFLSKEDRKAMFSTMSPDELRSFRRISRKLGPRFQNMHGVTAQALNSPLAAALFKSGYGSGDDAYKRAAAAEATGGAIANLTSDASGGKMSATPESALKALKRQRGPKAKMPFIPYKTETPLTDEQMTRQKLAERSNLLESAARFLGNTATPTIDKNGGELFSFGSGDDKRTFISREALMTHLMRSPQESWLRRPDVKKALGLRQLGGAVGLPHRELGGKVNSLFSRKFGEKAKSDLVYDHPAKGNDYDWQKLRKMAWRNQPHCSICGSSRAELKSRRLLDPSNAGKYRESLDHIVPMSEGGAARDIENLMPLCSSCNSAKAHKDLRNISLWPSARPNLTLPKNSIMDEQSSRLDWMDGGKFFGTTGIADFKKRLTGKRQLGGELGRSGAYVVGEAGKEIFVPESAGWIIPNHLMDQLPRREKGGPVGRGFNEAGKKGMQSAANIILGSVIGSNTQRVFVVNWPAALISGMGGSISGYGARANVGTGPTPREKALNADLAKRIGDVFRKSAPRAGVDDVGDAFKNATSGKKTRAGRKKSGEENEEDELIPLTPAEQEINRIKLLQDKYQAKQWARVVSAKGASALQTVASRAFGPATGQALAATLGGRGDIVERQRASQDSTIYAEARKKEAAEYAAKIADRSQMIENNLNNGFTEDHPGIKAARAEIEDFSERLKILSAHVDDASGEAEALAGSIVSPAQRLRVFGTNLFGIAGGMVMFQTAMAAVQIGTEALAKNLAPAVDTLTGFGANTTRVTNELGKSLTEFSGNIDAVFGTTGVKAGLSFESANKMQESDLATGAIAKSAAATQEQAVEMFRGMAGSISNSGLYGGTGGLFNTPFLADMLGGSKGFNEVVAGGFSSLKKNLDSIAGSAPGDSGTGTTSGYATDAIKRSAPYLKAEASINEYVNDLTEASKRGASFYNGDAFEFKKISEVATASGMKDADVRETYIQSARAAGDEGNASTIADAGYVMVNSVGGVVSGMKEYETAIRQLAKGKTMTDAATYAKTITQGLKANRELAARQRQDSINTLIPFQIGLGRMSSGERYTRASAGITRFGATGDAGKNISSTTSKIWQVRGELDKATDASINKQRQFVQKWGGNVSLFDEKMGAVQQIGQKIGGIQTKIFDIQLGLSNKMYANTIRLAKRAVSDAKGLATGKGGPDNLGAIQNQQTMLGFGLQQRQIMTQLALARFQAPGQTGEERYAKSEEAVIEAGIAQKQLDLAKKAFGIEATRGMTDTGFQLSLTLAQRNAELELIAQSKLLAGYENKMNEVLPELNAVIEEATGNYSAWMGEVGKMAATFGISVGKADERLNAAFTYVPGKGKPEDPRLFDGAEGRTLNKPKAETPAKSQPTQTVKMDLPNGTILTEKWSNSKPFPVHDYGKPKNEEYGGKDRGGTYATGVVGMTTGRTSMTVGEAGSEHVAVLRNPRNISVSPASQSTGVGNANFNITINYTGGGSAQDAEELATAIARKVEREMARRGMLMGLKGAAY